MTDFNYIRSRFDKATNNAAKPWTYGAFLLYEEEWGISSRSNWPGGNERIQYWNIEGSATFAGVELLALKPWYIANYGAWNETWWASVKAANNRYDPRITAYSGYHLAQLLKAWHIHMHNLGKKSMFIGIVGIPGGTGPSGMLQIGSSDIFPSPSFDELLKYDMLIAYQYPTCISCTYSGVANRPISASVDVVKKMREQYHYIGKLVWILTAKWPDGSGTTDINVQQAEFNAVASYVDIIIVAHKADMISPYPGKIPMPERLIMFYNEYNKIIPTPTPSPTSTIKPTPTVTTPQPGTDPFTDLMSYIMSLLSSLFRAS